MSILRKHAIIESIVWGFATIVFFALFFSTNPDDFFQNKILKLISVIPIAFGYLTHFYILSIVKKLKKSNVIVFDERDEKTMEIANNGAFIMTLLFVFIFLNILFEYYESNGSVPVVFMWFLSYATLAVSFLSSAIAHLVVDFKNS